MNRVVVVIFVAAMVLIAGCSETIANSDIIAVDAADDVTKLDTGEATDGSVLDNGNFPLVDGVIIGFGPNRR